MPNNKINFQILDIVGISEPSRDSGLVSKVISGLADEIGMKLLGDLKVVNSNIGFSYIQLIRESHIAAYQRYSGLIIFSIVSCKYFDDRKAASYITSKLSLRNVEINSYRK